MKKGGGGKNKNWSVGEMKSGRWGKIKIGRWGKMKGEGSITESNTSFLSIGKPVGVTI